MMCVLQTFCSIVGAILVAAFASIATLLFFPPCPLSAASKDDETENTQPKEEQDHNEEEEEEEDLLRISSYDSTLVPIPETEELCFDDSDGQERTEEELLLTNKKLNIGFSTKTGLYVVREEYVSFRRQYSTF